MEEETIEALKGRIRELEAALEVELDFDDAWDTWQVLHRDDPIWCDDVKAEAERWIMEHGFRLKE